MVQEVAILFEDYLWRGNRATKHSSDNFNAFKSNNYPRLAKIGLGITFREEVLWRNPNRGKFKVNYGMDTNVLFMDLFPGINERVVRHMLNAPGVKGIVMKTFGAGNGPTDPWFLDAVKDAISRGIVIVNVSQCNNGMVNPLRYEAGCGLYQAGVVSGRDITSEAAITKLMYLLAQDLTPEEVTRKMETPLAGEMKK